MLPLETKIYNSCYFHSVLQVNNVQLMLRRLAETAGIPEGKVRIQMAVEKSAGPILIFSLATSLPFLAGFWSTFKAIRLVSAYTGTYLQNCLELSKFKIWTLRLLRFDCFSTLKKY